MSRVLSAAVTSLALVCAAVMLPSTARADAPSAQVCIPEDVRAELSSCPDGTPTQAPPTKVKGVAFHAPTPTSKATAKPAAPAPPDSLGQGRDPRGIAIHQRVLALLVTEIQQLESLLETTALAAPDRPQLLRRLAEDYVELENAAFRQMTTAGIVRAQLAKTNPRAAAQQQAIFQSRRTTMERARAAAVRYYATIVEDYSGRASARFPATPPAPYALLDEVLYYLAYEYEQASDATNARRVYLDLITKTPASKFVPSAYLAFGELFFGEAQTDPSKWEPAKQAYLQVVARPPPANEVYGYAWYKLAYVFWNLGELPQALNAFKKTIDYGAGNPQGPGAAHLAETARKEIVTVYALAGDPSGAYAFFKTLSGDPPASSVRTYEMMNGLGRSYLDSGHYPEAISLYRDLLVRDATGDRTCDYQSHVTEATMAMKSGDKTAITGEIDKQLERLAAFRRETHADESKQRCANLTAALASETAMAWHLEAVGTDARRGTGDPRTMDLAAALYAKVASTFTAAELASFTFPHLVREDWPTLAKIRYAMADLLYARERWGECGKAFDDVVAEDPKGELAKDAAYVSVLCHYDAYLGSHRSGAERVGTGRLTAGEASRRSEPEDAYRTRPLTADENGMVRSFDRYLCAVGGDVADAAVRKQRDEVSFARCRLYFDAKQWGPSAACFHDIAFRGPDGDAGDATRLYLESLEVLARHGHPDRPACIDDMASDVPKLQDRLCTGDGAQHDEVICSDLTKVACSIERIRAQRLVELADEGGNDAVELFEKGARAYLSIWDRYGASRLRENKAPQCERLDEVLENAARAFQAAHLIASAIRTRSILVDPLYHLNGTDLAKDAAFKIGGNWQAIAVYDQAADWYESYAQRNRDARRASATGRARPTPRSPTPSC